MSTFFKKIFMVLIGCVAGMASWSVIEILLYYGESISNHLLWNGLAGASIGLLFGFFFGSAEGIMFSDSGRALRGGIIGAILGFVGGAGAMIISQWILYGIGNTEKFTSITTTSLIKPLSRAFGWSILGLIIGSLDGIRSGSTKRTLVGITGGLIGGFIGGVMLEFLTVFWSKKLFTRLGSSSRSHLPLKNYSGVRKNHAIITANRNGVKIRKIESPIIVNEKSVIEKELKYEDVIQLGNVKLLYLPK